MADIPTLPRVIGHRGAMAYAPENTLAGIREAARRGAAWVEFDVRLSADGLAVVIHDARLERTTNGRGPVAGAGYDTIAGLDAGAWFAPEFAGQRVPLLGDVVRLAAELGLGINVELKPARKRQQALCLAVLGVLAEGWPKRLPPVLLSSFERKALAALRDLGSPWPSGLLVKSLPRNWSRQVAALGCLSVHAAHAKLSRAGARAVKSQGLALAAYTLDSPARADELFAWGVDAVFSNAPDIVMAGIKAI
ncbi:MAG: glycerophosphodiester phosphodiesterase family protein [Alphaproteobacteria bacterium]